MPLVVRSAHGSQRSIGRPPKARLHVEGHGRGPCLPHVVQDEVQQIRVDLQQRQAVALGLLPQVACRAALLLRADGVPVGVEPVVHPVEAHVRVVRVHGRVAEDAAVPRDGREHLGGHELGARVAGHRVDADKVPVVVPFADEGAEAREGPPGLARRVLDLARLHAQRPLHLVHVVWRPRVRRVHALGLRVDGAPPALRVVGAVALGALGEVGRHARAPVRAPVLPVRVRRRSARLLNPQ
mmetsp:Transcript_1802/g.4100  ORF Transcript_1802/g.4100 Transcript_1802/m.4100 type:complete len:240 (-) Transcript_1802:980-1699(-)